MAGFKMSEWIERRPEEVFIFMTDPANASKSMHNIVKLEQVSAGPMGVGTTLRETRRVQGKEQQAELTIVRFKAPHHYAVAAEQSGITVTYHYRLIGERHGTRIDLTCEVTAKGLKKITLPLVAAIMKREDGNHLRQLKAAVEPNPQNNKI